MLNPPELRPSIVLAIVRYLDAQRGKQDSRDRLLARMAPATLGGADPQRDVSANLSIAIEIGLVLDLGDTVRLADEARSEVKTELHVRPRVLREFVFSDRLNSSAWPSQRGARDLTNALSWFLTFSPSESPVQMEGAVRSAQSMQTRDFGPRQGDDASNWPIGNSTRWQAFRRWACSLGFAWVDPNGFLVPDPTVAIRDQLPKIFGTESELTADDFINNVAHCLPVLDRGRYRQFVVENWQRPVAEDRGITACLTDSIARLATEGAILVDDRADSDRVVRSDGSTFSHVRTESAQV